MLRLASAALSPIRVSVWPCPAERTDVAQLDVDKLITRFRERAEAVKDRGVPPIEGSGRKAFIEQAENDYLDYSLIGKATWSVEDEALVLRIPLA